MPEKCQIKKQPCNSESLYSMPPKEQKNCYDHKLFDLHQLFRNSVNFLVRLNNKLVPAPRSGPENGHEKTLKDQLSEGKKINPNKKEADIMWSMQQ